MNSIATTTWQRVRALRTLCTASLAFGLSLGLAPRAFPSVDARTLRDTLSVIESGWRHQDSTGPTFTTTASLDHYLERAADFSPTLKLAFYRFTSAVEHAGFAGTLPDPTFNYTQMAVPVETRVGPQNRRIGIRQTLPWFGTLGAEKAAATQEAVAALREFETERLRLFYRVKAAYYDFYRLGRELDITRENLELLRFWESVARSKYRVSLTSHPDVIKAQVALGELEDRVLRLEDLLEPAATRLRAEVQLPDTIQLEPPREARVEEEPVDRERILSLALSAHPDLQAALARIERERANRRLAVKKTLPTFGLGIEYIETGEAANPRLEDSGKDPWMISASVTLPIWTGSNASRRRAAEARLKQSEYAYQDTRNRLRVLIAAAAAEHADALRKLQLYRDGLIPKAEQSLDAAYTAYEAGETDFLSVLDAQRQLLDFELRYERAVADLAIRTAELEMLCGGSLESDDGMARQVIPGDSMKESSR